MCTIKQAFIRTAEAERDKNQESLEKTWRRATTQQLKTPLTHHSDILDCRGEKIRSCEEGVRVWGGHLPSRGESCCCVIGLYLHQKSSACQHFLYLAALRLPRQRRLRWWRAAASDLQALSDRGRRELGAEKDRLCATSESLRRDTDVRSALVSCN